jgi:hypothetical protein
MLPRQLVLRFLSLVVERAMGRTASPDPRSLAVVPYLRRGERVPEEVTAAAIAAARAGAARTTNAAYAACVAACATIPTTHAADVAADAWADERRQQLADLLRLVEEEGL